MEDKLLLDLAIELPNGTRLHRAAKYIRKYFDCDSVAILMLDTSDNLQLIAADGLSQQALGRHFSLAEHPRFARIMNSDKPIWFSRHSNLPDPFDGLFSKDGTEISTVHDCIGMPLYCQGSPWGLISIEATDSDVFAENTLEQLNRFGLILQVAAHVKRLEHENRQFRLHNSASQDSIKVAEATDIIGQSQVMQSLLRETDIVADSELPILLLGETGVGKDLFARRLHAHSRRSNKPLVQVNCAALPEALAESELFGHIRGAFSGANQDRAGRFEAAEGGTLFLDEIGELPLSLQAKLLRVLQNGEIQRLGTDRAIKTDVRIIAATNRDLKANMLAGSFRSDLYHRLSVYPIQIPALRKRGNDILILAGYFLERTRGRLGLRGLRLSHKGQQALLKYNWPGNVRELEHIINRAALKMLSKGATRDQIITIATEQLGLDIEPITDQIKPAPIETKPVAVQLSLKAAIDKAQIDTINHCLQQNHGNWAQTARVLEIDPSNLHKLAKKLGLKN